MNIHRPFFFFFYKFIFFLFRSLLNVEQKKKNNGARKRIVTAHQQAGRLFFDTGGKKHTKRMNVFFLFYIDHRNDRPFDLVHQLIDERISPIAFKQFFVDPLHHRCMLQQPKNRRGEEKPVNNNKKRNK